MSNKEEYVLSLNETLTDFLLNLAKIIPNSLIGKNIDDIEKAINDPINMYKFIDVFVARVLKFKPQIDSILNENMEIDKKNEEFFLRSDYSHESDGDSSIINKIFEFKNLWKRFDKNNKIVIIQYLQILCELSQEYFLISDN